MLGFRLQWNIRYIEQDAVLSHGELGDATVNFDT